jgi:D-proline reductase (dithiol) PrdB
MKSDGGWVPEFRARYGPWWAEAAPLLARHEYGPAFKTYPWPTFETTPWTPLTRPLAECRLGLVTTAGLYRPGIDPPFDGEDPEGDRGVRALPREVDPRGLAIGHTHIPREVAQADMNTVFPLERLGELEVAGAIGSLADRHWSLMGYVTRAADLAAETAPAVAQGLKAEGVEVALVIPV